MISQDWKDNGEGLFEYRQEEGRARLGFMDLLQTDSGKLVIKHTEVKPEMEGKGIGRQLLDAVADYSRTNNLKVLPICPFAKNLMDRDPNKYGDLV